MKDQAVKSEPNILEIGQIADSGATPGFSVAIITPEFSKSISHGCFTDARDKEVGEETMYDLASVTKLYTTAVLLRLYEHGKLSIYDVCAKYLENFAGSKVQLIDLLTHRVDFGIELSKFRVRYPTTFAQEILKIKPPAEPASDVHYANLGFIYLGKIVEMVENQSLDIVTKNFFIEMGLHRTTTGVHIKADRTLTPPTEVMGNDVVQSETHDESARLLGGVAGNAGVFASARDLALFGNAWVNGKIIGQGTTADVFKNYNLSGRHPQGLGWWQRLPASSGEIRLRSAFCHPGFTGALLLVNPLTEKVCAFTCNRTYYGRGNERHRKIWELLAKWADET